MVDNLAIWVLYWIKHSVKKITSSTRVAKSVVGSDFCLTLETSKQVYRSLVQVLFDYADVAWGEITQRCYKNLQRLQNRAAPRIKLQYKTPKDSSSTRAELF